LNGGTLFALGGLDGVRVTVASSAPDLRNVVAGAPVTFTATVAAVYSGDSSRSASTSPTLVQNVSKK
jgi:hypothetical protein